MGYQINYSYVADKKYWRKRVWKGGGGGTNVRPYICQLSVTVYMIIND